MKKILSISLMISIALFMATGCKPEPEQVQPAPKFTTPAAVDALASDLNAASAELFKSGTEPKQSVKETKYFKHEGSEKIYINYLTDETDIYTFIIDGNTLETDMDTTYTLNGKSVESTDQKVSEILDAFDDLQTDVTKIVTESSLANGSTSFSCFQEQTDTETGILAQANAIKTTINHSGNVYNCIFKPTSSWQELLTISNPETDLTKDMITIIVNGENIDIEMQGLAEGTRQKLWYAAYLSCGITNGK